MRYTLAAALISLLMPGIALAATTSFGPYTWKQLAIGAGGWADGLDIAPDGTKVMRNDTYGGYVWNGSMWQQLVTNTSMPAPYNAADNNEGIFELRIAPSNSSRFYMIYEGYVFRSDNKGATWSKTAAPQLVAPFDSNNRMTGEKMAVDPANPDVVYAGSEGSGVYMTTSGGSSWTKVAAIPNGAAPGITGIAFDPSGGQTNLKTNIIYIGVWGSGVYRSTDGGVTWAKTVGGPTTVHNASVGGGVYYAADGLAAWKFSGGVWTKMLTGALQGSGAHSIALDPANTSHLVAGDDGGAINSSLNGGSSWLGWSDTRRVASDIPWLAWTNESYMSSGNMMFDPSASNKLYFSQGIGAWWSNPASTATSFNTWNSQNVGNEQLVGTDVIVPPGGKPVVTSWDRPVFYSANPDVYPSTHGPDNQNAIIAGWDADYAAGTPTFVAALMNWGSIDKAAYSTNGGQTWTQFPTKPVLSGHNAGGIAVATPQNIVIAQNSNGKVFYTTNGGSTWASPASLPTSGWGIAYYTNRHIVAADRVNTGTFYAYNFNNGVYRSTDGGVTWALVHSGVIVPGTTVGDSEFNAKLKAVPGQAKNLFYTNGQSGNRGEPNPDTSDAFMRSTDAGATWTKVANLTEVYAFGFGAPAVAGGYPSIYAAGWADSTYGIYRSTDNASTWTQIGDWPTGSIDQVTEVEGDPNIYGRVYLALNGSGFVYGDSGGSTIAIPTVTFSANPVSISAGQSATLYWSSTNATSCSGTNFAASATSGTVTVMPSVTTTYTVTCTGTGGTASQNATVTVSAPFDTTPPSVPTNLSGTAVSSSQINLTWAASTDNVAVAGYYVYRNGSLLSVSTVASYSDTGLTAGTSYTYTVAAYDAATNKSAQSPSVSATTQTTISNAPTASLSANPTSITAGQSSTLTWSSTNATSCTGTGFIASGTSGSLSVTPSVTTTYSVTCTGAAGTSAPVSATVTVGTIQPSIFGIGARVQITSPLNIRNKGQVNGSKILCTQPAGALGTIIGGPRSASGYTWWNVDYDALCDGWSAQNYLAPVSATVITPPTTSTSPTASLSANPTSITAGQSSTLTWSSTNATSCTGTGFIASGTSGSLSVTPSVTTTYSVTCTGAAGTSAPASATVTVVVSGPVAATPLWTLTASPAIQSLGYGTNVATFSNVNIGAPSAGRLVVVGVSVQGTTATSPASVNIGGIAATKASGSNASSGETASLWYANIPSGATASIVVTQSGVPYTIDSIGIAVGTLTGVNASPSATAVKDFSYVPDPQKVTLTVPANGIGIVAYLAATTNPTSWSNATSDTVVQGGGITLSLAHTASAGSQVLSVNGGDDAGSAMAAAAWGGSLAQATIKNTLAKGSTGTQVVALQTILTRLGLFSTEATGYFGSLTESAVKTFQSQHSLASVGIVGPQTRALIKSLGW